MHGRQQLLPRRQVGQRRARCFGNPAGFLFCVDAETGDEFWKFEMGGAISVGPAIGEGKVFAGLNINFALVNIAFEVDRTGEATSGGVKLGFRF